MGWCGAGLHRLLEVAAPAPSTASATRVTLANLRLIGGKAVRGGAVLVTGGAQLTVSNCELLQNAAVWGGAVYTDGETLIVRCALSRRLTAMEKLRIVIFRVWHFVTENGY
jgi:hypothetical protein